MLAVQTSYSGANNLRSRRHQSCHGRSRGGQCRSSPGRLRWRGQPPEGPWDCPAWEAEAWQPLSLPATIAAWTQHGLLCYFVFVDLRKTFYCWNHWLFLVFSFAAVHWSVRFLSSFSQHGTFQLAMGSCTTTVLTLTASCLSSNSKANSELPTHEYTCQ